MNNLLEEKFEQFPEDEFIASEQLNKRIYDIELDISAESLVNFALEIQINKNISFEAALLKAKNILLSREDEVDELIDNPNND